MPYGGARMLRAARYLAYRYTPNDNGRRRKHSGAPGYSRCHGAAAQVWELRRRRGVGFYGCHAYGWRYHDGARRESEGVSVVALRAGTLSAGGSGTT